jgi:hypothetical protein
VAERVVTSAHIRSEQGVALVIVLLMAVLLSALGLALALLTTTDRSIAAGYGWSAETFYAADAGIARTLEELAAVAAWNDVLGGRVASAFSDGAAGPRVLATGLTLDLNEETDRLNCGHRACSGDDLTRITTERPWGVNNPVWQLYAHEPMATMVSPGTVDSTAYVAVWVSDDPLETDGDPLVDGNEVAGINPGRGILQLRAHAYGPAGATRIIEVTVRRAAASIRLLSWREIRR